MTANFKREIGDKPPLVPLRFNSTRGGFSSLKDRLLERSHLIKIARRFYWLNAFLTKPKSVLTENVLNQWTIIKNITNCGLQPHNGSDNHQDYWVQNQNYIFRLENWSAYCLFVNINFNDLDLFSFYDIFAMYFEILNTQFWLAESKQKQIFGPLSMRDAAVQHECYCAHKPLFCR